MAKSNATPRNVSTSDVITFVFQARIKVGAMQGAYNHEVLALTMFGKSIS
jgi:hypothetical protein